MVAPERDKEERGSRERRDDSKQREREKEKEKILMRIQFIPHKYKLVLKSNQIAELS
jgi:hypothetical protein